MLPVLAVFGRSVLIVYSQYTRTAKFILDTLYAQLQYCSFHPPSTRSIGARHKYSVILSVLGVRNVFNTPSILRVYLLGVRSMLGACVRLVPTHLYDAPVAEIKRMVCINYARRRACAKQSASQGRPSRHMHSSRRIIPYFRLYNASLSVWKPLRNYRIVFFCVLLRAACQHQHSSSSRPRQILYVDIQQSVPWIMHFSIIWPGVYKKGGVFSPCPRVLPSSHTCPRHLFALRPSLRGNSAVSLHRWYVAVPAWYLV